MTPRLKKLIGKMLVRPLTDDEQDELAMEYADILQDDELEEMDTLDSYEEQYDFDDLEEVVDSLLDADPGTVAWVVNKPKEKYKN